MKQATPTLVLCLALTLAGCQQLGRPLSQTTDAAETAHPVQVSPVASPQAPQAAEPAAAPQAGPVVQEAEQLDVLDKSADTHLDFSDGGCSEQACALFMADAAGDYVTYGFGPVVAGTYDVVLHVKKYPTRGTVQLSLTSPGGQARPVGPEFDLYAASTSYEDLTVPDVTVSTGGEQRLTLSVTGRNAASSGYRIGLDRVAFAPSGGKSPVPTPAPSPAPAPSPVRSVAWSVASASPISRGEADGAGVNGRLYVMGGFVTWGGFTPSRRMDAYDPTTDSWTRVADLPEGLTHAGVTSEGHVMWVAGGYPERPGGGQTFSSTHVYRYDTDTDTWSRGPDLPVPRAGGALQLLGRELHYVGGSDANRQDADEHYVLNLDGGAGWHTAAPLPSARNHVGSAVVGGKLYVVGGQKGQNSSAQQQREVSVFDPARGQWSAVSPLPEPARSHLAGGTFVMDGRIVVLGGDGPGEQPQTRVDVYDPASNTWSSLPGLPDARRTPVAGYVDGFLVATTGENGSGSQSTTFRGLPQR